MDRAATVWALALAAPLALDAWLVRHGRSSLSTHARCHPYVTASAVTFFVCHLMGRPRFLKPMDPLRVIGQRLKP